MANYTLDGNFEDYFEFNLIGISSHSHDYRLCWALNKFMEFDFKRDEKEIVIRLKEENTITGFSKFSFICPESEAVFELISNRNPDGYLIPELRKADYFLKFDDFYPGPVTDIIKELRNIPLINLAFEVDVESLKSKLNLIY